ncbi:hypothetical protein H6G81_05710 [Scytonema hofmannii FACHB-248]|uniref:Uncharacterized protein n=1 Tax=Scytonema hofmannii FACHB-248 TaxID=1842502 RepID=A0ABR8GLG1_9CYAN|nr:MULTISPECIES: hypothetical protein [Nostocales]MBD2604036.1 hypothetical protein [Scytonema hofmannii FACHB-248]
MDMKSNLDEKKARFQNEDIPHRLGHIASNLARVRSFCNSAFKKGVEVVIDETEWFIEWTAAEIEPEQAEELVNIQVQLARWQINLDNILLDELRRGEVAKQAETYSQKVLDMSGLLDLIA